MSAVKKWSVPLEVSESYSSVTQLWNMDVNMDMELNINVRKGTYSMQYVPLWRALACVIDKLMIHSQ